MNGDRGTTRDILASLEDARETGSGWTSKCPAHDDSRASLSIGVGNDGRVLLHCHAGCETEEIVRAAGLRMSDLFPVRRAFNSSSSERMERREFVAVYDYRDELGDLLYQVVRFEPKDFRLRRPDGAERWAWGLNGARRVLYRLPEVLAAKAQERAVIIVEGEKDADALVEIGLTATTIAGGAGGPLPQDIGAVLADMSVTILPDNDSPGRGLAARLAQSLASRSSVKIVQLPGLPEKADVSDWLARGGTREQLLALIERASDYQPVSANGSHPQPTPSGGGMNGANDAVPVRRLALVRASDVEIEAVTYIWNERIPRGKVTCLEGRMGVGKTTILTEIIGAVTRGSSLPGQSTTPTGAAILISLEDGLADTLVPRLQAAGADLERCHLFNGYEFGGERCGGVFSLAEDIERLRWAIAETGAVFVAIDPFTAALGATVNSYKDQDVRRVLAPLAQLAEDTHAAIAFDRHLRKGGGSAEDAGGGSVGIGAACRSVLRVDVDPENPERYLLSSVKASVSKRPPTLGYRIEGVTLPGRTPVLTSKILWDGESTWTADALASHAMSAEERPRADEAQDWLRDALNHGAKRAKELFKAAESEGISRRTLHRAADVLKVEKDRKGFGEGSLWSLPASIRAKEPSFAPSTSVARMGTNGVDGDFVAVDVAI